MAVVPTWGKRSKFSFTGSTHSGTTIRYGAGFKHKIMITSLEWQALLAHFHGSTVIVGGTRGIPKRNSLDSWLKSHFGKTVVAPYVAAILEREGLASRDMDPSKIKIH